MSAVRDLIPGQQVVLGAFPPVTFVAATDHPLYPGLMLVVWRFPEGHPLGMEWSHDALSPGQDVGEAQPSTRDERVTNLRRALLDRSQW